MNLPRPPTSPGVATAVAVFGLFPAIAPSVFRAHAVDTHSTLPSAAELARQLEEARMETERLRTAQKFLWTRLGGRRQPGRVVSNNKSPTGLLLPFHSKTARSASLCLLLRVKCQRSSDYLNSRLLVRARTEINVSLTVVVPDAVSLETASRLLCLFVFAP